MRWAAPAVALALLGPAAARAHAQGQQILEVERPVENEGMFVVGAPQFEINQATFDQWIYGNRLRTSTAVQYLESLLDVRLAEVGRACKLSDSQLDRLRLAGRGDIKRFGDRVAEVHADFDRLKRDQSRMNDLFQRVQPLAAQLNAGLFGDGSIFAKSIGTTLTPEQAEAQRAAARAKARYRYRAKVLLAVANLDAAVGLTSDQQRRYVAAILDGTTPPERPGGQYEGSIILLKIATTPEPSVRPIFDDEQWALLQQQFAQARAMEPFLRANGHLDGKGPAPAPGVFTLPAPVPGQAIFAQPNVEIRVERAVVR